MAQNATNPTGLTAKVTGDELPVFACIREEVSGKVLWEGGPYDTKSAADAEAMKELSRISFKNRSAE